MINKNEIEEIICQYKEEVIIQLNNIVIDDFDSHDDIEKKENEINSFKGKLLACDKLLDKIFIKMNKNIEEHARLHNQ